MLCPQSESLTSADIHPLYGKFYCGSAVEPALFLAVELRCVYVHVCAETCASVCECMGICGQRPEGNTGCHSSVTLYLVLEIRSLAEIWGLPIRLSRLAGKPQGYSRTCQCGDYQHMPSYQAFFIWALAIKPRLSQLYGKHFASRSTFLTRVKNSDEPV